MYPEEKEDTYCQGYKLDGSREGIDARGQDGTDIIRSRVVIVICPATADVIAGRSRLRFGWRTRSVILHGRGLVCQAIAIHCIHPGRPGLCALLACFVLCMIFDLPSPSSSLHAARSSFCAQCVVRALGFAIVLLITRSSMADVMMTTATLTWQFGDSSGISLRNSPKWPKTGLSSSCRNFFPPHRK